MVQVVYGYALLLHPQNKTWLVTGEKVCTDMKGQKVNVILHPQKQISKSWKIICSQTRFIVVR